MMVDFGSSASTSEIKGREVLDNLSKLEIRILALERDRISHFRSWRHEFHATIHPLEDMETRLAFESREKRKELCNQIKQIKQHVTSFGTMLTELNSGQTFIEKLKCTMEEIEASITTFKRKHSDEFELLLQEEVILAQEITAFDKKLESWSTSMLSKQPQLTACISGVLARQQCKPDTDETPSSVLAFERFLQQTGGHQGGWDDYDHQTFLKLHSKHSDLSVFLERAAHEIPTKSLSEIQQHKQWYTEYSTLLDNKKKAIITWKKQKQSKREDTKADKDLLGTKGQFKRNEVWAKEREERFARLPGWKAQQEKNRTKLEEERLRVELDNKKAMEKEKKRRVLIKQQVEEHIQNLEEREKIKQQGLEMERMKEKERRKAATKEVARFRKRDLMKVAEQQEAKLKEKAKADHLRERQLERLKQQVKVNAERDPCRLLKATASVKEKGKGGPGSGLGGVMLIMPRRAVPSWRQT